MFIRKAERKKAKLRLGIAGASGSGKTWSALEIATGMGGKIGMIDTEAGRGELYGNDFEYDIIRLEAPYRTARYIEAIKAFENAGYDILIIDSLSHAWDGSGGVLSTVDAGGGWFTKGGQQGSAEQNALIEAIITSKLHIITTLRAKTEYAMEKDDRGKMVPHKLGLKPIQRDNIEYEYTVFMNMNQDHIADVSKDNTKMFGQRFIKPNKEMGAHLTTWLNMGVDIKERFEKEVVPVCLSEITKCNSLTTLEEVFTEIKSKYLNDYREYFVPLIEAKNKRKDELMDAELAVMEAPPIKTTTKYSSALTSARA